MLDQEHVRFILIEAVFRRHSTRRGEVMGHNVIQSGSAHDMNPILLLAYLSQHSRVFSSCDQMNVRESRYCMSVGFVNATGYLSTVNVCNRDVHVGASHRAGEHLPPVSEKKDHIRTIILKGFCQVSEKL
jgi:hypothetical protein